MPVVEHISSESDFEIITPAKAIHRMDRPARAAETQFRESSFVIKHGLTSSIPIALQKRFPIHTPGALRVGKKWYLRSDGKWSRNDERSERSEMECEKF